MGRKKDERQAREAEAALALQQEQQATYVKQVAKLVAREAKFREIRGPITDEESVGDRVKKILAKHETTPISEREKKWRLISLPNDFTLQIESPKEYIQVKQGYTPEGVRLRAETTYTRNETGEMIKGATHYFVSYKTHLDQEGIERYETPAVEIEQDRFTTYWDQEVGNSYIIKNRHEVNDGLGNTVYLDVYRPELLTESAQRAFHAAYGTSLIVAEIEFDTTQKARDYQIPQNLNPGYFLDCTGKDLYDNKTIAYICGEKLLTNGNKPKTRR